MRHRRTGTGVVAHTHPREQRGQATIEMIGIIPLAVLILGGIIQLYMVGYAAVSAESAARLAAREASKGMGAAQAEQAGARQVNQRFEPQVQVRDGNLSASGQEPSVGPSGGLDDPVSAKATLTVPFLGIGVANLDIHVTRYSVVPRTSS